MKLLLCTLNKNKIKEIKQFLKDSPINIITLFDLKETIKVKEDGETFKENALIKAKYYGTKHQIIAIGDDTGLEVDYLNGGPGVYTNRYEKTDKKRNEKLLKELLNAENRKARFKTVIALYNPFNEKEYYFEGVVNGEISKTFRGSNGFGYDPIFYIPELKKTMAEISIEKKNDISHRGKALKSLKEFLNENINNF